MRPDDAAVDHQVIIASIPDQALEHLLPDTLGRPAGEPLVHAFVGSVVRWQVAPACPGAQHPQHAIDEGPVVGRCTARIAGLARKEVLDPLPLGLGQLVATGAGMLRLRHPPKVSAECRFGLPDVCHPAPTCVIDVALKVSWPRRPLTRSRDRGQVNPPQHLEITHKDTNQTVV